jgi:hypothetical protein
MPAMHLITLSASLGVRISVAKRTCDEYNIILEEAGEIFKKWNSPIKFLESADNEFLVSFWSEKQSNEALSWDDYYQRMKDVGKLLTGQGIFLYVESMDNIKSNKHFGRVTRFVDDCYVSTTGRGKSGRVCEHDALLMLLMRELRREKPKALLGPDYWFITEDHSLFCVDNKINSIADFQDKIPSSMLCDIWLDMISPFLPISTRETDVYDAFTLMVKNQFALVPFQIDTAKLVKIQGTWTQYEWLDAKDVAGILNQDWTKQYLRRLEKAKTEEDKVKAEEMGKAFANKLEEELQKIRDDKLKKLLEDNKALLEKQNLLSAAVEEKMQEIDDKRKQVADIQRVIESQKADLDKQQLTIKLKDRELEKETSFKRRLRIVSAIAGLFLIISPLLVLVTKALPIQPESVAFCTACMIVGAILLYFGIAPERASVAVGANVGLPAGSKQP